MNRIINKIEDLLPIKEGYQLTEADEVSLKRFLLDGYGGLMSNRRMRPKTFFEMFKLVTLKLLDAFTINRDNGPLKYKKLVNNLQMLGGQIQVASNYAVGQGLQIITQNSAGLSTTQIKAMKKVLINQAAQEAVKKAMSFKIDSSSDRVETLPYAERHFRVMYVYCMINLLKQNKRVSSALLQGERTKDRQWDLFRYSKMYDSYRRDIWLMLMKLAVEIQEPAYQDDTNVDVFFNLMVEMEQQRIQLYRDVGKEREIYDKFVVAFNDYTSMEGYAWFIDAAQITTASDVLIDIICHPGLDKLDTNLILRTIYYPISTSGYVLPMYFEQPEQFAVAVTKSLIKREILLPGYIKLQYDDELNQSRFNLTPAKIFGQENLPQINMKAVTAHLLMTMVQDWYLDGTEYSKDQFFHRLLMELSEFMVAMGVISFYDNMGAYDPFSDDSYQLFCMFALGELIRKGFLLPLLLNQISICCRKPVKTSGFSEEARRAVTVIITILVAYVYFQMTKESILKEGTVVNNIRDLLVIPNPSCLEIACNITEKFIDESINDAPFTTAVFVRDKVWPEVKSKGGLYKGVVYGRLEEFNIVFEQLKTWPNKLTKLSSQEKKLKYSIVLDQLAIMKKNMNLFRMSTPDTAAYIQYYLKKKTSELSIDCYKIILDTGERQKEIQDVVFNFLGDWADVLNKDNDLKVLMNFDRSILSQPGHDIEKKDFFERIDRVIPKILKELRILIKKYGVFGQTRKEWYQLLQESVNCRNWIVIAVALFNLFLIARLAAPFAAIMFSFMQNRLDEIEYCMATIDGLNVKDIVFLNMGRVETLHAYASGSSKILSDLNTTLDNPQRLSELILRNKTNTNEFYYFLELGYNDLRNLNITAYSIDLAIEIPEEKYLILRQSAEQLRNYFFGTLMTHVMQNCINRVNFATYSNGLDPIEALALQRGTLMAYPAVMTNNKRTTGNTLYAYSLENKAIQGGVSMYATKFGEGYFDSVSKSLYVQKMVLNPKVGLALLDNFNGYYYGVESVKNIVQYDVVNWLQGFGSVGVRSLLNIVESSDTIANFFELSFLTISVVYFKSITVLLGYLFQNIALRDPTISSILNRVLGVEFLSRWYDTVKANKDNTLTESAIETGIGYTGTFIRVVRPYTFLGRIYELDSKNEWVKNADGTRRRQENITDLDVIFMAVLTILTAGAMKTSISYTTNGLFNAFNTGFAAFSNFSNNRKRKIRSAKEVKQQNDVQNGIAAIRVLGYLEYLKIIPTSVSAKDRDTENLIKDLWKFTKFMSFLTIGSAFFEFCGPFTVVKAGEKNYSVMAGLATVLAVCQSLRMVWIDLEIIKEKVKEELSNTDEKKKKEMKKKEYDDYEEYSAEDRIASAQYKKSMDNYMKLRHEAVARATRPPPPTGGS